MVDCVCVCVGVWECVCVCVHACVCVCTVQYSSTKAAVLQEYPRSLTSTLVLGGSQQKGSTNPVPHMHCYRWTGDTDIMAGLWTLALASGAGVVFLYDSCMF